MRESRVGDAVDRFNSRYKVDQETGCWNWISSTNKKGYGLIGGEIKGKRYGPKGSRLLAHRVSWIIYKGEIPESDAVHGVVVMHKCDNPACVNPEHLKLGTQSENVQDMDSKGRRVTVSKSGAEHWKAVFSKEQIEYICSIKGSTKALAKEYGVSVSAIKNVRARNGLGDKSPTKFHKKSLTKEQIDHIRETPPGTKGLAKLYGISNTSIRNIRNRITYPE